MLMGLLDSDAVRAPAPAARGGRAEPSMAATLRSLGLLESGGGRIATPTTSTPATTREAVA